MGRDAVPAVSAGCPGPSAPGSRHRFWLRLTDRHETRSVDLPLLRGYRPAGLDLEGAGVVHESHGYDACILTDAELAPGEALWLLNDDEPVALALSGPLSAKGPDGDDCLLYQLLPGDDVVEQASGDRSGRMRAWRPFELLYGFAHIAIGLSGGADGQRVELSTRDVACVCDRLDQEVPVAEMVRELTGAPDSEVIAWMLGRVGGEAGRHALVGSSPVTDSSESLESYLALCERVLRAYEHNLSFFCHHAHSRTVKADALLAPSKVRRAGRRELLWLASNPDMLQKAPTATAIRLGGESYTAARLRTELPALTFDNRENRALLAFADEVAASLTDIAARAREQAERLRAIGARLRGLVDGTGLIPSLVVIDACLSREEPLIERAFELRRRARKVSAALARALPQVERVRYRLPARTKPFQEIPAYVELYALMRGWNDFGAFDLERDGLVLHTWRMDKLYEYYLLYLLLSTLRDMGFRLDARAGEPVGRTRYSLQARFFRNEEQVAGVYRLAREDTRAEPECVTLYYQPVFYADGREEHGVDLHRTTATFGSPYWTPDYLLVVDTPDGCRRRVVLDAKFRRLDDVRPDRAGGEAKDKKSTLLECQRKYLLETAGPKGVRPDAVWLLCGRAQERALWVERLTDWACEQGILPSGAATAVPGANALEDVLAAVGIAAARPAGAAGEEDPACAEPADAEGPASPEGCAGEAADALEPAPAAEMPAGEPIEEEGPAGGEEPAGTGESAEGAAPRSADLPEASRGETTRPKVKARPGAGANEARLQEAVDLLQALIDRGFKHDYLRIMVGRRCGIPHPLIRERKPEGREARLYSKDPVEIGGEPWYVFTGWQPNTLARLRRF